MVTTLTLNPAVDFTVYLDSATVPGTLHRSRGSLLTQGGKGTNVSLALKQLGDESNAVVLLGGANGRRFYDCHLEYGLTLNEVPIAAETRMNVKIIDGEGKCTEFNQTTAVTDVEIAAAERELDRTVRGGGDILVMSGSVPAGVSKSVYARLCEKYRALGASVIVDCDGDALRYCMECGLKPDIIKPNLYELCGLAGVRGELDVPEIMRLCRKVARETGVSVLCTADSRGAVAVDLTSDGEPVYQPAPKVTLRGFTGAGDTFLAAYIHTRLLCGKSTSEALKFAVSASAAKVELAGTQIPTAEQMGKFVGAL